MKGYRIEFTGSKFKVGEYEEMGKDTTELLWRKTIEAAEELVTSLNSKFVICVDEDSNEDAMQICNCVDCGTNFILTKRNFDFFKKQGFPMPKRCSICRKMRKK